MVVKFRFFSVYSDFFSHLVRFCVRSKWQVSRYLFADTSILSILFSVVIPLLFQDTREFAFKFQTETPVKKGVFTPQDRALLERIIAQVRRPSNQFILRNRDWDEMYQQFLLFFLFFSLLLFFSLVAKPCDHIMSTCVMDWICKKFSFDLRFSWNLERNGT